MKAYSSFILLKLNKYHNTAFVFNLEPISARLILWSYKTHIRNKKSFDTNIFTIY